jgi:hypothetical protein
MKKAMVIKFGFLYFIATFWMSRITIRGGAFIEDQYQ